MHDTYACIVVLHGDSAGYPQAHRAECEWTHVRKSYIFYKAMIIASDFQHIKAAYSHFASTIMIMNNLDYLCFVW